MPTISLCMIVKNEEEVLANCLSSVEDICDEIIIVDTGSTDRTKEIASKFTDKIYDFTWIDDFSAARNYSFSLATKDYILWLDADDVILPEEQKKFKKLKKNLNSNIDAVSMNYIAATDGNGNPTFHYRRNRLVKRSKGFKWIGPVHEYLAVHGNILEADISIHHKKREKKVDTQSIGRNLRIYENRIKNGEEFSPRDLFYYANELKDHKQYNKAIIYYQEFLDGKKGWIEDNIRACIYMADCYARLGEKENELMALFKTFNYDEPRSEACCRIGDIFQARKDFKTALFWYQLAVKMKHKKTGGFHHTSYTTWYPHLALCVCYWQLGNVEESIKHHELTKQYIPNDPKVLYNEEFFQSYLKNQNRKDSVK
ncbi:MULTISPECIES: tetratricopeptide repeat-containing glycosyltransferase family 2 protein [Ureibacillus]|jgi:glycosyltransferase involved in cell wall biosynthesis|uniref:tetratricopeptide repeat-containing glycosyltransferase family 2 protein n=1 Tax=Ureibacillus TaxID=160795 RepID=UPI0002EB8743|nr:glycosyltransferase [Ureibacillus thermosphaericus]